MKVLELVFLIVLSVFLIACQNGTDNDTTSGGTTNDDSGTTTITIIDTMLRGEWESNDYNIGITDDTITITNKWNQDDLPIEYKTVSINDKKIVAENIDDPTKMIEINIKWDKDKDDSLLMFTGEIDGVAIKIDPNATNDPNVIYVSIIGNDYRYINTASKPFKTITKALSIVTSDRNTIYVRKFASEELVYISNYSVAITIKGGYNASWIRSNENNKSIINGDNNTTASSSGRITISAYTKVTLENLDIKGALYTNSISGTTSAYGIYNHGDLTVDNCDIVGIESGVITLDGAGAAYGVYNIGSGITISSGTITGFDSTSGSFAYGVYTANGILNITGGTITGAAGQATVKSTYGVRNIANAVTTISGSNCYIYAKESTVIGVPISYYALSGSSFYKGTTGNATIKKIKGVGAGIDYENWWNYPFTDQAGDQPFKWDK